MNTVISRIISIGFLLLLVFLSGFWLSRSGKPYHLIIFTLHKLITLGLLIFLTITAYQIHKSFPLQGSQMVAIVITVICLAALMITGGLLSLNKVMPDIILRIHHVLPYLTVISVGVTVNLLLFRASQFTINHNSLMAAIRR